MREMIGEAELKQSKMFGNILKCRKKLVNGFKLKISKIVTMKNINYCIGNSQKLQNKLQ